MRSTNSQSYVNMLKQSRLPKGTDEGPEHEYQRVRILGDIEGEALSAYLQRDKSGKSIIVFVELLSLSCETFCLIKQDSF